MLKDVSSPALRFYWLAPLYDWLVKRTSRESLFKQKLVKQAGLSAVNIFLDVGCGTATLLSTLGRKFPDIELHSIVLDPEILRIARQKVKNIGAVVDLEDRP